MALQSHTHTDRATSSRAALSNSPMLTFVPWVIFWIVAGPRTWEVASGCALLSSLLLLVVGQDPSPIVDRAVALTSGNRHEQARRPIKLQAPKILDLGTIAFFLVLVIIGLFVDRHALIGLEKYSQAISSAALGLIVIASIVLGHPFTEQYAREGVPEEVWDTPEFRRTMVLMSGVWVVIFAVMAILGLVAETGIAGAGSSDLLNWYIPIGLVILGFQFNKWYPSHLQQSGP
jgi:hypothetical protein